MCIKHYVNITTSLQVTVQCKIALNLIEREKIMSTKDSNGTLLSDGDTVQVIKDLKVKGTSMTLKRGTLIKNIRLTDDEEEIECNAEKVKNLVLKTCFLKKV